MFYKVWPIRLDSQPQTLFPLYSVPSVLITHGYDTTKLGGLIQQALDMYKKDDKMGPTVCRFGSFKNKHNIYVY